MDKKTTLTCGDLVKQLILMKFEKYYSLESKLKQSNIDKERIKMILNVLNNGRHIAFFSKYYFTF